MSNYMNMSGFSPREAASMIFKFWKSCHRCLNAPLQKIISCPRPDYSDLVGLLHIYYLSCPFIYIHKRNRIIHTPITALFKNFIVTLAYSSSLLIFYSISRNHSTLSYFNVTENKQCFTFLFHLLFSDIVLIPNK